MQNASFSILEVLEVVVGVEGIGEVEGSGGVLRNRQWIRGAMIPWKYSGSQQDAYFDLDLHPERKPWWNWFWKTI
jgi:hypothetical protein